MTARYRADELRDFAAGLFEAGGMPRDRADIVAHYMVEADLMGHDTHGLNLAPLYLDDLESGRMAAAGEPETVRDTGATVVVDGGWLSGLWLIDRAIDIALDRVATYGTVTVVMRRAHHSGCLAAFLEKATARGRMIMLSSSAPAARAVAPHGSYEPVYTPDPLAFGIPTEGDPVLVDISASTTTMNLGFRLQAAGKRFGGPWLIDGAGRATDDPNLFSSDAPGAIMPLGGLDLGHKGFGLGIFVEALTSGLGGYGRADAPDSSPIGCAIYLQVIDPDAFGGGEDFRRQTTWFAEACRAAKVPEGRPAVRMPGDGALARRRDAVENGVPLHPAIYPGLEPWAEKAGLAMPAPIG